MRWRHPRSPNLRLLTMEENRPAMFQKGTQSVHAGSPDSKIGEPNERKPWGRHLEPSPATTLKFQALNIFINQNYQKPNPKSKLPKTSKLMITLVSNSAKLTKLAIPSSQGNSISIPSPPEILLLPSVPSLGVAVAHGPCVVDSWRPLSTPPGDGFMASEGW